MRHVERRLITDTDNSNRLVMVIRNYHWLNSASRVLISTCSAPLVQTGERKQFSLFDLDLQSQASQGQGRLSCQKSMSKVKRFKQESAHRQTDGHTHWCYQTYYLPCYTVDKHEITDHALHASCHSAEWTMPRMHPEHWHNINKIYQQNDSSSH